MKSIFSELLTETVMKNGLSVYVFALSYLFLFITLSVSWYVY